MEEKSEKVAKKDDKLLTINKEKEEMMKEVTVKQKKPYVAPTCEVIKLEGGGPPQWLGITGEHDGS